MKITSFSIVASALILPLAHAGELKPSRLIAPEQVESQVDSFSNRLAITERAYDPFGKVQDLDAKLQTTPIEIGHPGPKALPFAQVVDTIQVVAVAPAEGRIIANGGPCRIGQKLIVPYKGVKHEVELTAVAEHQIEFKNVKTGEVVSTKFKGAVANPLQKDNW